ncbi:MAG: Gfo/Idh/MocA family protein [Gemmobacter sp.]
MTRRLRGGLIGCGFFSENHLHAWTGLDGVDLVAVCDVDRGKADAAAARFGVPAAFTDADAMLRTAALDFVDIVTTSPSHRALVELAAAHGVAAKCQKPFADTLEDARAMVDACDRAGVPLMVHENFRWQRPLRVMGEVVDSGALGRPNFARFSFRHGYDNYANQPYLAQIERFAIMDVGLHLFDLARRFLGEADSLFCRTQRLNPVVRGEDSFHATLRHASGAVSICDCSFWTRWHPEPFPQVLAVIEGDEATVELSHDLRLRLHRAGGATDLDAAPTVPPWGAAPWHVVQESVVATCAHWRDCLLTGATPQPSGADNLQTLALALAAYESAAGDRALHRTAEGWA